MKAYGIIFAAVLTVVVAEFYSSKYDDFDVQTVIENDRILLSYTNCFLDEGPCAPDAKDFKKVIPEALENTCAKCTHKQRQLIKAVIRAIKERHPDAWEQLTDKYDPDRKFKASFDKFIDEQE